MEQVARVRSGRWRSRRGAAGTRLAGLVVVLLGILAGAACSGGASGRVIGIAQTDEGCAPRAIILEAGEKVTFEVKNEGAKDREVEGIDGTRLEEVLVPAGRVRRVPYTAPAEAGTRKIKCYVPGGNATIIVLQVSGSAGASARAPETPTPTATTGPVDEVIDVELDDYSISPSKRRVQAGRIAFETVNLSPTKMHELVVLRQTEGGGHEALGELENLAPGSTARLVLDLGPGRYLLACLIVPGEAGSEVDHFQQGMFTGFEVE